MWDKSFEKMIIKFASNCRHLNVGGKIPLASIVTVKASQVSRERKLKFNQLLYQERNIKSVNIKRKVAVVSGS